MSETVKVIKEKLLNVTTMEDPFVKLCEKDERKGVQTALIQTKRRLKKAEHLLERFEMISRFEKKYHKAGFEYIAGIDEVGRGPLAGPVVACSIVLPKDFSVSLVEVNDSKQLSLAKREELFDKIMDEALAVGIGIKSETVIDSVNIYEATKLAMIDSINELGIKPDYLLIDAMTLPVDIPQDNIIKGDANSISIACASIIAKVTRDRMMFEFDNTYPGYGFATNAGYGTKEHLIHLKEAGITPIHRKSFEPIKSMVNKEN